MYTESCAHTVYDSYLFGKFMDVNSAVVSQADILPLTQNTLGTKHMQLKYWEFVY